MKKTTYLFIVIAGLIITSCNDDSNIAGPHGAVSSDSYIFVACEGNYYEPESGSISIIDEYGNITSINNIGSVVQSVEVYEDKLFVIVNDSHMIKIYEITDMGLTMPGIEISTQGSSPREMIVVDDKLFFTNWNSNDVKVLNLFTYDIETNIPVGDMPEDIITDGVFIWVANSGSSSISKIDPTSYSVETFNVGEGPVALSIFNDNLYASRTYYDQDWNSFYGTSRINLNGGDALLSEHGSGSACGGSIMNYNGGVYRSYDGGVASIDENLIINSNSKVGEFDNVYHIEIINNNIWFCITDFNLINEIEVVDYNGNSIASYPTGIGPGDIAVWHKNTQ